MRGVQTPPRETKFLVEHVHRRLMVRARLKNSSPRLKKLPRIVSSSIAPIPAGRPINDCNDGWVVISDRNLYFGEDQNLVKNASK
jgi:hypothetical protein